MNQWPYKYFPSYEHLCKECLFHLLSTPNGLKCGNVNCKDFAPETHEPASVNRQA